jgi:hypothetical protein
MILQVVTAFILKVIGRLIRIKNIKVPLSIFDKKIRFLLKINKINNYLFENYYNK